ncbi:hypothetical protein Zm00014a_010649 [Zea mays]|uniref:C2 NT-type domain-containing protein n=1 Tax=Zea mays TaxID=4577 RepID=A0A3L6E2B1_MAIZE|nr:hypothetical protein Zm00014a_010649 [Zea mays]
MGARLLRHQHEDINKGPKNKPSILGTVSLNLADYALTAGETIEIILPLSIPGGAPERASSLHLTLSMVELRAFQETSDASQRSAATLPLSPSPSDSLPGGKYEVLVIKAGLRKVKILTDLVSTRRPKKTCQGGGEDKFCVNSDSVEYPCDTESLDDDLDDRVEEDEFGDSTIRKSFSYGESIAINHREWLLTAKRSILPWRKRKLSLRSLKAKGEPLLKKAYGGRGRDQEDMD